MSMEESKAVVRQAYEAISSGNLDALIHCFSSDYVDHSLPPGLPPGPEGLRLMMTGFLTAFPDLQVTPEALLAEGDTVAARLTSRGTHQADFQGIPATGKQITLTGIEIFRVVDGKVAERWGEFDFLGLLHQLGALPPQGQANA